MLTFKKLVCIVLAMACLVMGGQGFLKAHCGEITLHLQLHTKSDLPVANANLFFEKGGEENKQTRKDFKRTSGLTHTNANTMWVHWIGFISGPASPARQQAKFTPSISLHLRYRVLLT
ncbi:MAG: hypothetical protein J0L66_11760 [Cytophagales bacterium]|nr:hypothetical protein [Cytophagales bacterium]